MGLGTRVSGWVLIITLTLAGTACGAGQGRGASEQSCADELDNDDDGATDCADSDCAELCSASFLLRLLPDSADNRAVDILLVLDNSPDTDVLDVRYDLPVLFHELRQRAAGLPDLHLGVTTTDLGGGTMASAQCDEVGDEGRLIRNNCSEPLGVAWIVDSAPRSCLVERDAAGQCLFHECTPDNCVHEPTTELSEDADGCPRCRNYIQQSAGDVLACLANVGWTGCPYEQQLEAMYRALNNHPDNVGFLREEAHLAVVLLNTEDDCSVSDPYFWDNSDLGLESELGPASDYRCFEFGVTCDENDRTAVGPRTGCRPREDDGALLHPIRRYTDFLLGIKPPFQLTVVTLAGPMENEAVSVRRNTAELPEVDVGCLGRYPGIRLNAFSRDIQDAHALATGIQTQCDGISPDRSALQAGARSVLRGLGEGCAPVPPLGCTDVAAALGQPGDGRACNDRCAASCEVTDIQHTSSQQETATDVMPCVQVCHDGPCPLNEDPSLAWYSGHPPAISADLPVASCWHFTYQEHCVDANGAQLVVARREPLADWSYTEASCAAVLSEAGRCTDGLDNDGDCLTDLEDPDCGLAPP